MSANYAKYSGHPVDTTVQMLNEIHEMFVCLLEQWESRVYYILREHSNIKTLYARWVGWMQQQLLTVDQKRLRVTCLPGNFHRRFVAVDEIITLLGPKNNPRKAFRPERCESDCCLWDCWGIIFVNFSDTGETIRVAHFA